MAGLKETLPISLTRRSGKIFRFVIKPFIKNHKEKYHIRGIFFILNTLTDIPILDIIGSII